MSGVINLCCFKPTLPDWTTGSKSLDSFIMESWSNMKYIYDAYIQWIEYSLLTNIHGMTSLRHGCTHVAEWTTTRETLKKIIDDLSFDFYQVNYFMCKMQIVLLTCVSHINIIVVYLLLK